MTNEFLTIAGAFDWITPTVALLKDLFYGPVSDFGIPASAGWGRRDIKHLLKKEGVRVWGLKLNLSGEVLMFTVAQTQAQGAYNCIQRAGVPLLYAPAEIIQPSPLQPSAPLSNLY